MPAGDLLTAPGQIEWDGQLIRVTLAGDLWLSAESDVSEGWNVRHSYGDLPTDAGSAPGVAVIQAMYPTIIGLNVESVSALSLFEASMAPGTTGDLCWWDLARDRKYKGPAQARQCEPSTAEGVQLLPHRVVDCMWAILRPGDIEILL